MSNIQANERSFNCRCGHAFSFRCSASARGMFGASRPVLNSGYYVDERPAVQCARVAAHLLSIDCPERFLRFNSLTTRQRRQCYRQPHLKLQVPPLYYVCCDSTKHVTSVIIVVLQIILKYSIPLFFFFGK